MNHPKPILFVSDSPELPTGLARISGDLATLLNSDPAWRVGFLGLGGNGSRSFPFPIYQIQEKAGMWGEGNLAHVWDDFAGAERGVIMTVWDITRTAWMAMPQVHPSGATRDFLSSGRFKLWGYFPVDATGPYERFTFLAKEAYQGYNRVLFYTQWAAKLFSQTLARPAEWIPHGINLDVFKPHPVPEGRKILYPRVDDHTFLLGVVATNQARKDWGLVFETVAKLRDILRPSGTRVHLWAHTDLLVRYWNLNALSSDFGLKDDLTVTLNLSQEDLAKLYSACDITLAPGLGEGFGYPIVESLACGTPVIHGNYGGGAELLQFADKAGWLVAPVGWRYEGEHNCKRPVFNTQDWVEKILSAGRPRQEECNALVKHLDWRKLYPSVWRKWFQRGLNE